MHDLTLPYIYEWECGFLYPHLLEDVDFWIDVFKNESGPIFEAGAGTGRITIPLLNQGHTITALDISVDMLDLLTTKAENCKLETVIADLADFNLNRIHSAAFFPYTIFQLLPDSTSRKKCLKTLNKNLAQNGQVIFDLDLSILHGEDPEDYKHIYTEEFEEFTSIVSLYSKIETDHSELSRTWHDFYRIFDGRGNKKLRNTTTLYALSLDHMDMLLENCGFAVTDVFGGYKLEPLSKDSERMLIFAEKVSEASI